jgi:hypothetical protein
MNNILNVNSVKNNSIKRWFFSNRKKGENQTPIFKMIQNKNKYSLKFRNETFSSDMQNIGKSFLLEDPIKDNNAIISALKSLDEIDNLNLNILLKAFSKLCSNQKVKVFVGSSQYKGIEHLYDNSFRKYFSRTLENGGYNSELNFIYLSGATKSSLINKKDKFVMLFLHEMTHCVLKNYKISLTKNQIKDLNKIILNFQKLRPKNAEEKRAEEVVNKKVIQRISNCKLYKNETDIAEELLCEGTALLYYKLKYPKRQNYINLAIPSIFTVLKKEVISNLTKT